MTRDIPSYHLSRVVRLRQQVKPGQTIEVIMGIPTIVKERRFGISKAVKRMLALVVALVPWG